MLLRFKQVYINLNIIGFFTITAKKPAYRLIRKKALNKPASVHTVIKGNTAFWASVQIFQRQIIRIIHFLIKGVKNQCNLCIIYRLNLY